MDHYFLVRSVLCAYIKGYPQYSQIIICYQIIIQDLEIQGVSLVADLNQIVLVPLWVTRVLQHL